MNHKLIPALMLSTRQSELRNQEVLKYKVWKLPFGAGNWSESGNWSNNVVPSGGSNVLFGPYQGTCVVNTNTPNLNGFRVRNDYTATITSNKVVTITGYFTYYSDGTLSANYSVFNISGGARLDGDGRVFWDNSIWNLNGAFNQKSLNSPVDNFSTINMFGSGKTVYSEDELYRLSIMGATSSSGDLVIKGPLNVSGELTIPTGMNLINRGNKADIYIYPSGKTLGPGTLILENDAQIIRQSGYLGNNELLIRDNSVGEILPPATYSAKHITIQNNRGSYDTFVFKNGTYNFDSDVTIESTGGGTLEINNKFAGATVRFNRNFTVDSGTLSDVIWQTGNGTVIFGDTTSIGKSFTRDICERSGVNVVDSVRGLGMSHQNKINGEPIIWALHSGDLNLDGSGVGVRAFTQAGHTVGYYIVTTTTPATGFGDISISRTPSNSFERIFIGDIADPNANRPIIRIYRGLEPSVTGYSFYSDAIPTIYNLAYPALPVGESGGTPRDARALCVDYNNSDIYIITHKTNPAQLFFLEGSNFYVGTQTLGYSGNLSIGSGVVGMDISRDGKQILVKTWDKLYHYRVTGNNTICQTLSGGVPTEILDYNPGYREHGVSWGSGVAALNDTIYTMETFNENLHDPLIKSPLWLYRKRHIIDDNGLILDKVRVEASGYEKVLASTLVTLDFSLMSGIFNLDGNNLTSLSGLYAGPNSNFNPSGFTRSVITCGGDCLLVGSSQNYLNMYPPSGSIGWALRAHGNNRVYFANVRKSAASSGNTIYAYVSNDYGNNTNWIFSGGAPISGGMGLFISGGNYGMTPVGGLFPLSVAGFTNNTSGNLFLSITGGTPGSQYANIDLFISGGIRGSVTGGLYVTLTNSGVEGSIPLYIRGDGITSGAVPTWGVLYLTITNSGVESGLPISVLGGGTFSGGIPISIQGKEQTTGGIPLYIGSMGGINSGPNSLKIYTHGKHANN